MNNKPHRHALGVSGIRNKRHKQRSEESDVFPVPTSKAYRGSIGMAPSILNLSTRWEVSSYIHALTTLTMGGRKMYQLNRMLGGLQNQSRCFVQGGGSLAPTRIRTRFHQAHSPVAISTGPLWLTENKISSTMVELK